MQDMTYTQYGVKVRLGVKENANKEFTNMYFYKLGERVEVEPRIWNSHDIKVQILETDFITTYRINLLTGHAA